MDKAQYTVRAVTGSERKIYMKVYTLETAARAADLILRTNRKISQVEVTRGRKICGVYKRKEHDNGETDSSND